MGAATGLRLAALMALGVWVQGCGYHLANGSAEVFAPELGEVSTPHAAVAAALLEGARAELGRHGALGAGPPLRIDLLRVEERAEGIVAVAGAPQARAIRLRVVGRARVGGGTSSSDRGALRDTGDVEDAEIISVAGDPRLGLVGAEDAAAAAARRLGARLARRILGYPEP